MCIFICLEVAFPRVFKYIYLYLFLNLCHNLMCSFASTRAQSVGYCVAIVIRKTRNVCKPLTSHPF